MFITTSRNVDSWNATTRRPPKLHRRFPQVREVCELLAAKRWTEAVSRYHEYFGAGYADDWPMNGYAIPNFVKTLENYRL